MTNILVVDDSEVIRNHMKACLQSLGFEKLNEASNGQNALASVQNYMPDVIMLDWNMPVMDGLDFLKELRKLPDGAAPIVIFCTSESRQNKINLAMTHKANEYIIKPVDARMISEKFLELGIKA